RQGRRRIDCRCERWRGEAEAQAARAEGHGQRQHGIGSRSGRRCRQAQTQAASTQGGGKGRRGAGRRGRRRRAEAQAEEAQARAHRPHAYGGKDLARAMSAAGPAEPIPLTVLTGFLGAGKTSLLNCLIHDPALAETAVIINEFGEVGLDHLLVRPIREGVVLLQSGCLCCTLRGDLVDALEQLLRDLDNGRAVFRRVILETTGLADPAPVLQTTMAHPYLVLRYRLDGVITVVDAVNNAATLDAQMESVKQVAVADRIVLSKTDLAATPENGRSRAALADRLRALNPAAP